MKDKQVSPLIGAIVGVVALVLVLAIGYKFFVAPQPLPSIADHPARPGYTQYPGSKPAPAPGATTTTQSPP